LRKKKKKKLWEVDHDCLRMVVDIEEEEEEAPRRS
jgi:hypothetical protein